MDHRSINRKEFAYTPYYWYAPVYTARLVFVNQYSEENVYKLLEILRTRCPHTLFHVVFISNIHATVAIFGQSVGDPQNDYLVVWDYHVILLANEADSCCVYDFDCVMDFPVPFSVYRARGLLNNDVLPEKYRRYYRVVRADDYLTYFASDRRHMKRATDGSWSAPPPSYSCIRSPLAETEHNLSSYLDMQNPVNCLSLSPQTISSSWPSPFGVVFTEPLFFHFFSNPVHADPISSNLM